MTFLGWRSDIGNLLNRWDLLMVSSLDEGFGESALEAMAHARPVVGFRVGGLQELVEDGGTGALLPPGDLDALVQVLGRFSNDRKTLAALGHEGFKRAKSNFSVEKMTRQTTELYDRVIKRASPEA